MTIRNPHLAAFAMDTAAVADCLRRLIEAVEYDCNGQAGRGGNGGLISNETMRLAGEGRRAIARLEGRPC